MAFSLIAGFFFTVSSMLMIQAIPMMDQGLGCKGGLQGGAIKEENGYYYKCNNGMLDPIGCISSTKQRIAIGESFQNLNFEMKCVLNSNGFMDKEYAGCIVEGKTVYPGTDLVLDKVWYSCKSEKFYVELSSGCMFDGKQINKGETVRDGDISLVCHDSEKGAALVHIGCIAKGVEYKIGDSFEDDTAVYSCSTERSLIKRKVIGCIHNGKRLLDKDSFFDGDFVMMCKINEKGARIVQTGCVHHNAGTDIGKNVDCIWIDGPSPQQYHTTCKKSDTTGVISIARINCFYEPADGVIEPGCYRTIGDINVGCRKTDNSMEFVTFDKSVQIPFALALC